MHFFYKDRAERHDLKSRLWLFLISYLLFSSLIKKREEEKEHE